MINVTPQTDVIHASGFIFKNRVIYEADNVLQPGYYVIVVEGTAYSVQITEEWVTLPANETLDSRTPLQKMYDDRKQRDTDYIAVYKNRMGIHTFRSYAEEDYYRHKGNTSHDVGLPEGHSLSQEFQKLPEEDA